MCQPKPGPRCSSHAKINLDRAHSALAQASAVHKEAEEANSPERHALAQKVFDANDKYRTALSEFYTTPAGFRELEAKIRDKRGRGDYSGADSTAHRLNRGKHEREMSLEALRQARARAADNTGRAAYDADDMYTWSASQLQEKMEVTNTRLGEITRQQEYCRQQIAHHQETAAQERGPGGVFAAQDWSDAPEDRYIEKHAELDEERNALLNVTSECQDVLQSRQDALDSPETLTQPYDPRQPSTWSTRRLHREIVTKTERLEQIDSNMATNDSISRRCHEEYEIELANGNDRDAEYSLEQSDRMDELNRALQAERTRLEEERRGLQRIASVRL